MDVNQYMSMFLEEAREHLQTLNQSILELENNPEDLSILDVIFRSAHTIKGMSATMGFTTIAELTHEMENILDYLRRGDMKATKEIIDTIFKCVDSLEQLVEDVSNNMEPSVDVKGLVQTLSTLVKNPAAPVVADVAPAITPAPVKEEEPTKVEGELPLLELTEGELDIAHAAATAGQQTYEIQVFLRPDCILKSARVFMIMNALEAMGEVLRAQPPAEDLEKENFEASFQLVFVTKQEPTVVEKAIVSVSEVDRAILIPIQVDEYAAAPFVPAAIVEAGGNGQPKPQSGKTAAEAVEKIAPTPGATGGADKKVKGGQSVRVDIDKLDSLLNLVGELVINKTRLEQIGITHKLTELVETIEQMDRVTTDLQAVVMKVRMVPVGQVFNRFPRMVRDLSRELGKEVNLIIQGEETELDRTVIDEIGDPLVHLLRNAIDHGLERPADRQAVGKNPVGEIRLIARHEGNNVIILVEDDGKGINPEIIKQKAVAKGLISQAEAEKMEPADAVRLVFLPGFSTAEVVTDVSGRGVGMDAVKNKIESLGGMVDVETKVNEGSKFKIRLPLTLAIIQALMVKVAEENYAIPLGSIDSTINIIPADIKTIQNREVILLRGQIIPIVRLGQVLGLPETAQQEEEELFVVVVHMGDQKAGIIVDNLIGQQEIVIKSLGKLLAGIKVLAGATILGNGQVALILDIGALIQ